MTGGSVLDGMAREGLSEDDLWGYTRRKWWRGPLDPLGMLCAEGLRLERAWCVLGKVKWRERGPSGRGWSQQPRFGCFQPVRAHTCLFTHRK